MNTNPNLPLNSRFSTLRPWIALLGSLRLAMLLLAVIIVACIVGTVAESRLDTTVAQAYVYDASWFIGWLLVLCVNLACAVLARYPWKPHQIGFIVTHVGIVVLLIGAMVGRVWGLEGSITLFKGNQPASALVLNRTVLEVHDTKTGEKASKNLDLNLRPPTARRPVKFRARDLQISALDYAKDLGVRTWVEKAASNGAPAIHVVLGSGMVPQPIDHWLVLGDPQRESFVFGPTSIRFLPEPASGASEEVMAKSGGKPQATQSPSAAGGPAQERHFVFSKLPEMSMARSVTGQSSGVKAKYRFAPEVKSDAATKGVLELEANGKKFEYPVADILDRKVALAGTPWTLSGVKYLADFRLQGKEAVSASDDPKNPAVVFELTGISPGSANGVAAEKCEHEEGECDHTQKKACCPEPNDPSGHAASHAHAAAADGLTVYARPDGTLRYASFSKGQRTAEGNVKIGQNISTGLADWKITVESFLERAAVHQELAPLPPDDPTATGVSGVLVQLERAGKSARQWVATGTPAHLKLGDEGAHVSLGYGVHPLNFGVALDRFEVERDEGTQTPAGFKSHVRFVDPKNPAALVAREIWMNHPANFPDFPGVGLWGTAYKFSQASWNPNNLNQTTLQVVRDPGWSLKWSGSLMLCAGLFTMFYLKPYPRRNLTRKP